MKLIDKLKEIFSTVTIEEIDDILKGTKWYIAEGIPGKYGITNGCEFIELKDNTETWVTTEMIVKHCLTSNKLQLLQVATSLKKRLIKTTLDYTPYREKKPKVKTEVKVWSIKGRDMYV